MDERQSGAGRAAREPRQHQGAAVSRHRRSRPAEVGEPVLALDERPVGDGGEPGTEDDGDVRADGRRGQRITSPASGGSSPVSRPNAVAPTSSWAPSQRPGRSPKASSGEYSRE